MGGGDPGDALGRPGPVAPHPAGGGAGPGGPRGGAGHPGLPRRPRRAAVDGGPALAAGAGPRGGLRRPGPLGPGPVLGPLLAGRGDQRGRVGAAPARDGRPAGPLRRVPAAGAVGERSRGPAGGADQGPGRFLIWRGRPGVFTVSL
ncbi:hypothetical protein [Ornithinimicrobium kibberense]|uniref:hypothetical protein n=1 Tax=Ornithinimicrobium kibberense TaxID=282060 RepID=UPI003609518D